MSARPDVVERLVELLELRLARGPLEPWSDAFEAWVSRYTWSTFEERQAAYSEFLAPLRRWLEEVDRARQADVDSGLDDWAWCFTIGIAWST